MNRWFDNKPWKRLTRKDIQRVYDDLKEGRIAALRGGPVKDRQSFYNRILRGKPFQLAGKAEIAREVMQFSRRIENSDVRFIPEATFRGLVDVMIQPDHRLLAWLCFDIGENASSILALQKADVNGDHDPEEEVTQDRQSKRKNQPD